MARENSDGIMSLPNGRVVTRRIAVASSLGFAYERSVGYEKSWHTHTRLNIAFPRESSVIGFKNSQKTEQADQKSFLLLKPGVKHAHFSNSLVWDNFSLFPPENLARDLLGMMGEREMVKCERNSLLSLAVEDLFEKLVLEDADEGECEVRYFFVLKQIAEGLKTSRSPNKHIHSTIESVVVKIEQNLFERLDPQELAASVQMSRATLYRKFKKETSLSLMEYVRKRRFESAKQLLQTGDCTVKEVAYLVGYQDPFAFSNAYKNFFGISPSLDKPDRSP